MCAQQQGRRRGAEPELLFEVCIRLTQCQHEAGAHYDNVIGLSLMHAGLNQVTLTAPLLLVVTVATMPAVCMT